MDKKLELALQQLDMSAVVVSGPGGSGKTALIHRVIKNTNYKLVDIDTIEEYKTYRISKSLIYLLRVGEGVRIKPHNYRGIIFETENPYFYRKIEKCVHVKISPPTIRAIRKHCPSAQKKTTMHRILQAQKLPPEIHEALLETESSEVSFFHIIGKILYHKTEEIPKEVISAVCESPIKVLLYLHENIPAFTNNIQSIGKILDRISAASISPDQLYLLITEIWKLEKRRVNTFYNIRTSPYNMD
ncbi:hypothetical protein NEIRO03_0148 [Nematocida sp. AWRm78]|nr:hypothetical protein NEIRO02_0038 [Nematocida sp. AWRm79]KAI5182464.1 hypothetical protein NEIRO03_0148 [Nematocida sp. AWRm78]